MALRSSPVALKPIRNPRTASVSYRVTGTIHGKQRKRHFSTPGEALMVQSDWELERTLAAATVRPKVTRLTQQELAMAEAAIEMLRGSGLTLSDAVRHVLPLRPHHCFTFTLVA